MARMATIDDVLAKQDGTDFSIALSNLVCGRWDRDGFAALTRAEQVAYCVDALEREVANGGFDQFFWNYSGDTAHETLEALQAIGAPQAAALVREAIACFPGGKVPSSREERERLLESMGEAPREKWSQLDDRFHEYPDDLTGLMRAYVRENRANFRPWP
jgi:hypothetical protein